MKQYKVSQIGNLNPQIKNLTIISKQLYRQLNTSQLQFSRLIRMKNYQQMVQQLIDFNQELIKWKKNQHNIKNIVLTYHLYQNLYSRLKYVSIFSNTQQETIASMNQVVKWFLAEKPQKRNFVPQIQPQIKVIQPDPQQQIGIDDYIQTNAIKRQMRPFETMSRTAHSQFFPPKEALKDYRRKQFAPSLQKPKNTSASKTVTSSFKVFSTYKDSMATRSTFKQTKQSFKYDVKTDQIQQKQQRQNIPQTQQFKEQDRQKKVQQQQIIKQSIIPNNFQQDKPQQDAQLISQQQQPLQKPMRIKKFARDPYLDQELNIQEKIKDKQQSTLRRIINQKQQKIRIKLQQLDLKRNMLNWGKIKGKNKKQQSKKLQQMLYVNKFKDLQHKIPQPIKINHKNNNNKLQQINLIYRSKSSHPGSLESDFQKLKIKQTLKTYGRYLQHGNFNKVILQNQDDQEQLKTFRGNSLTSHAGRIQKKTYFGDILRANDIQTYNVEAQQKVASVKQTLSLKNISIAQSNIYQSMSIPSITKLKGVTMYTSGRDLLSNPFFPKHLYTAKKKKKKGK